MSYGKHAVQNCQNIVVEQKLMQTKVNNYIFFSFSPYIISDKKQLARLLCYLSPNQLTYSFKQHVENPQARRSG